MDLKEKIKSKGINVLDFAFVGFGGIEGGSPVEIYKNDILYCARKCDAFLAICDYPSIGLGYELSEVTRLGKPVLVVAHKKSKVTRLVIGASEFEPNITFERYHNLVEDVVPRVVELTKLAI